LYLISHFVRTAQNFIIQRITPLIGLFAYAEKLNEHEIPSALAAAGKLNNNKPKKKKKNMVPCKIAHNTQPIVVRPAIL
jgi:hypothetical protein